MRNEVVRERLPWNQGGMTRDRLSQRCRGIDYRYVDALLSTGSIRRKNKCQILRCGDVVCGRNGVDARRSAALDDLAPFFVVEEKRLLFVLVVNVWDVQRSAH